MEEEKNTTTYYLIILFIIGCVFGYGIKSMAKNKFTSGPDDKKITVVKIPYDLVTAQKNADEEMKKAQAAAQAAQQQAGPSGQQGAPDQGTAVPAPTNGGQPQAPAKQ